MPESLLRHLRLVLSTDFRNYSPFDIFERGELVGGDFSSVIIRVSDFNFESSLKLIILRFQPLIPGFELQILTFDEL